MNKFHAKPQIVDGIRFDSIAEAKRYGELKLLQRAGQIERLECHPTWRLTVNGTFVGNFTPDFKYYDIGGKKPELVVEDVKSKVTAKGEAYRLRLKVWQALYPGPVFREMLR